MNTHAYYLSGPFFYVRAIKENNRLDPFLLYSTFESYIRELEAR